MATATDVRRLMGWFATAQRSLPWRENRTPYRVWVSEVMLQQTTVDAVVAPYRRFLERFPTLHALAHAPTQEVLEAWAGLGYYRRARALHEGAQMVQERFGGEIPAGEAELRSLAGVGPYTASAIRSLAYGEIAPAVDGNVARVAARYFGIREAVDGSAARTRIAARLAEWVPEGQGAEFTEAWIELGALVCRPRGPDCGACPLSSGCEARRGGLQEVIPQRTPRPESVPVLSLRAWCASPRGLAVVQRPADASLLPGWWELPGAWVPPATEDPGRVLGPLVRALGFRSVKVGTKVCEIRHTITRHRIRSVAYQVRVVGDPGPAGRWVSRDGPRDPTVTTETRKLLKAAEAAQ